MEATWRHRPDDRPSFAQLVGLLEEARPEQLQAVLGAPQRSIVRQLKARAAQLEIQEEVEEYARARNQPLFGRFA